MSEGVRSVETVPLLRRSCLLCGRPESALCPACARRLPPAPVTRVRGVGRVPAVFGYEGSGATVVQALKFRDGRRLVGPLADLLVPLVAPLLETSSAPVVAWLPTSAHRRRARGFDQAELLARAVARRLEVPVQPVFRREPGRGRAAQTGRSRAERDGNVRFRIGRRPGGTVVALDDVCTTGATMRAAAAALGDGPVRFAALARTP